MGVRTDAILVYGLALEEDAIDEWDEGQDAPSGPGYLAWSGETEDGVGIVTHCSDKFPMHIVAIDGSEVTARRGYPKAIDPSALAADPGWDDRLRAFAGRHRLPVAGEPGWLLCSWWG